MKSLIGVMIGLLLLVIITVFSNKDLQQIDKNQPYTMHTSKVILYILLAIGSCYGIFLIYLFLSYQGNLLDGMPAIAMIGVFGLPGSIYFIIIYGLLKIKFNYVLVNKNTLTLYHLGRKTKYLTMQNIVKLTKNGTFVFFELDDDTMYTYNTKNLVGIELFMETLAIENPNCLIDVS